MSSDQELVYSRICQPAFLRRLQPCSSHGLQALHAQHQKQETLSVVQRRLPREEQRNPQEDVSCILQILHAKDILPCSRKSILRSFFALNLRFSRRTRG